MRIFKIKKDQLFNIEKMKNCRICLYIRYFIGFIILIIVTALLYKEKMHYLSFVTPWNAVIVIFIFGIILFLTKLLEYLKDKN